jgi:hypothetical protein
LRSLGVAVGRKAPVRDLLPAIAGSVADGFAPKNNHYACKSREGNGDLRGCAENFPRFHANPVCSAKFDLMRRKASGSLKSLVRWCVSITLPAAP